MKPEKLTEKIRMNLVVKKDIYGFHRDRLNLWAGNDRSVTG